MIQKRWLQRDKLRAVHDNDLEQFLASLGVLDGVVNGNYHCIVCGLQISIDNLGAASPKDNEVALICNRPACLLELDLGKKAEHD